MQIFQTYKLATLKMVLPMQKKIKKDMKRTIKN